MFRYSTDKKHFLRHVKLIFVYYLTASEEEEELRDYIYTKRTEGKESKHFNSRACPWRLDARQECEKCASGQQSNQNESEGMKGFLFNFLSRLAFCFYSSFFPVFLSTNPSSRTSWNSSTGVRMYLPRATPFHPLSLPSLLHPFY